VLVKAEETVDNTTDTANVDETTEIMVNGSPTNSQVVRMPAVERTVVVGQHDRSRTPLESATTDEYTSGPVDASDGG
jgi:hypothetical protein